MSEYGFVWFVVVVCCPGPNGEKAGVSKDLFVKRRTPRQTALPGDERNVANETRDQHGTVGSPNLFLFPLYPFWTDRRMGAAGKGRDARASRWRKK